MGLFPTARRYQHLSEVEQLEWDVLVSVGEYKDSSASPPVAYPADHLYIIAFGATDIAHVRTRTKRGETSWYLTMNQEVVATQFTVGDQLPNRLQRLIREDLIQQLKLETVVARRPSSSTWPRIHDGSFDPSYGRLTAVCLRGAWNGGSGT